jgi:hypothetical protein
MDLILQLHDSHVTAADAPFSQRLPSEPSNPLRFSKQLGIREAILGGPV